MAHDGVGIGQIHPQTIEAAWTHCTLSNFFECLALDVFVQTKIADDPDMVYCRLERREEVVKNIRYNCTQRSHHNFCISEAYTTRKRALRDRIFKLLGSVALFT